MAAVVAVVNQKGGVAKTTTVRNLGVALAHEGQRVLLVDLDPQANLTTSAGIDVRRLNGSTYNVLVQKQAISGIIQRSREGLDVAPADEVLMRAEMEMGGQRREVDPRIVFASVRSAAAAGKPNRWQAVRKADEGPPGSYQSAGQIRPGVTVRAGVVRQSLRRAGEQGQIVGLARMGDRIRLSHDGA